MILKAIIILIICLIGWLLNRAQQGQTDYDKPYVPNRADRRAKQSDRKRNNRKVASNRVSGPRRARRIVGETIAQALEGKE